MKSVLNFVLITLVMLPTFVMLASSNDLVVLSACPVAVLTILLLCRFLPKDIKDWIENLCKEEDEFPEL